MMAGPFDESALRSQAALDGDRALRLVLASLRDDSDATALVFNEIAGCPNCLRGALVLLAGMYAADLNDPEDGGLDAAISRVEWMLSEGMDKRLQGEE